MSPRTILLTALTAAFAAVASPHAAAADDANHRMIRPDALQWSPVASLPAGAEVATLEGNLGAAGPFTVRLRFPANYRIPPHWHPTVERVTVLTGSFNMALGERFDAGSGSTLEAGGMMLIQPKTPHFAWTTTAPAVIQLHGTGPWEINYVDAANDPRKAR